MSSTTGAATPAVPAVELSGVTKRFGAIVACDEVDLTLWRGRIHGILGENGAGKSTLMKVLIGLVPLDSGTVSIGGETVILRDPLEAARHGIGMVHQHFSLVEPLTVWENVMLGEEGRFDPVDIRRRIAEISERYGLGVEPDAVVADLPVGLRQRVEIIKCLRRDPEIIIFDEPTSVLTPAESERLFEVLRQAVQEENRAVALVSHKLDEVLGATDEITIMRSGRVVGRIMTPEADAPGLARAMVGREVSLRSSGAALGLVAGVMDSTENLGNVGDVYDGEPVLSVSGVVVDSNDRQRALDGLSLDVFPGEIVGVAGVEGNGQEELTALMSSLVKAREGAVRVDGQMVETGVAGSMAIAGVAVVPADRHDSGVVLELTVAENLFLVDPVQVSRRGFWDRKLSDRRAQELISEFEIQTSGPTAPLWSVSGGNQQRIVLARELSNSPKVLVVSQPTRGLDVGAIEYISGRLRQAKVDGVGILLISSELEEILDLADRIIVLFRGRVIGEMPRTEIDLDGLSLLMGGVTEPLVGSSGD